MTVAELIERLRQFPSGTLVVVPGSDEAGFDDIETIEMIAVVPTKYPSWACKYDKAEGAERATPAVLVDF